MSSDEKLKEAYQIIVKLAVINYAVSYDENEKTSESKAKKGSEPKDKILEAKGKRLEKDKKLIL